MIITCATAEDVEAYLESIARIHQGACSKRRFSAWLSTEKAVHYCRGWARRGVVNDMARQDSSEGSMSADSMIGFEIRGRRLGEGVSALGRANRGELGGLLLHHLTHLVKRVCSALFALRQGHCRPFAELRLSSISVRPSEQGQRAGASLLGTFAAPPRRNPASSSRPKISGHAFPSQG